MDVGAIESYTRPPKKKPYSFWCALLRLFSSVKPSQITVSPPLHVRPPPRRLRKRRRPSRPPLPMLRDLGVGEPRTESTDSPWTFGPMYEPEEIMTLPGLDAGFRVEKDYDRLLCSHLSRFVPHTLETIQEVDGEYACAQGRKPVLKIQPGSPAALRLAGEGTRFETSNEEHDSYTSVGLPPRNSTLHYEIFNSINTHRVSRVEGL
ncbi:hypothetical protein JB92DRAFT_179140 [Gautieria morchelliformis]|nr:hypothetical protein JB92DRAFT_179140 [Gautieria morchelliformis]